MNSPRDFREMTASSIGADLLKALLDELRLLPKPWPQLPAAKQDDIIERLKNRIQDQVNMAVHLLYAEGRTVVVGDLDQITIKGGTKALIKIGRDQQALHELYDASGKQVMLIVSNPGDHLAGMDDIVGEDDQRSMDLGHEYRDDDGGGMEDLKREAGVGEVIDAEPLGLPSPDDVPPSPEEKEHVWDDGYAAAEAGKPESDCPTMKGALCIEWVKGWKAYHEAYPTAVGPDEPNLE